MKTNDVINQQIEKLDWRNDCTSEADKHYSFCQGCEKIVVLNREEVKSFASAIIKSVGEEVEETIKNTRACRKRGCLTCGQGNGVVKVLSDLQALLANRKGKI